MCEPWRAVAQRRAGRPLPLPRCRDGGRAGEALQRTREATRCRAPRGPRRLRILRASLRTLSSKWRRKASESLPRPDGQWPEGACSGTLAEVKAQVPQPRAAPRSCRLTSPPPARAFAGLAGRYLMRTNRVQSLGAGPSSPLPPLPSHENNRVFNLSRS